MDEKIIVTSDKMGIIEMAGCCSIITLMLIGIIISYIVDMYKDGVEILYVVLIIALAYVCKLIICTIISYWIAIGRRILMDQEGCQISLHGYSRFYRWDEIQVKRYEKGPAD